MHYFEFCQGAVYVTLFEQFHFSHMSCARVFSSNLSQSITILHTQWSCGKTVQCEPMQCADWLEIEEQFKSPFLISYISDMFWCAFVTTITYNVTYLLACQPACNVLASQRYRMAAEKTPVSLFSREPFKPVSADNKFVIENLCAGRRSISNKDRKRLLFENLLYSNSSVGLSVDIRTNL